MLVATGCPGEKVLQLFQWNGIVTIEESERCNSLSEVGRA